MSDIVTIYLVSHVIALYLIMRLVYPKDKMLAGILLLVVGAITVTNMQLVSTEVIEILDMNAGGIPTEQYRVDTNAFFLGGGGAQTGAYGIIIMVVGLIVIIKDLINKTMKSRR